MVTLIDPDTLASLRSLFPVVRFTPAPDPAYDCPSCPDGLLDPCRAELIIRYRRGGRIVSVPSCGGCGRTDIADVLTTSHVVAVDVLTERAA